MVFHGLFLSVNLALIISAQRLCFLLKIMDNRVFLDMPLINIALTEPFNDEDVLRILQIMFLYTGE